MNIPDMIEELEAGELSEELIDEILFLLRTVEFTEVLH